MHVYMCCKVTALYLHVHTHRFPLFHNQQLCAIRSRLYFVIFVYLFILYLLTECKQRTDKRCLVADYKILWKQTLINLSNIVDTFIKRDF